MGWSEFDEEEAKAIQARVDAEVAAAVLAEREACAKVCEGLIGRGEKYGAMLAGQIRARSNVKLTSGPHGATKERT